MLKRFMAYYKPHKKLLFLDMTASLLVALIGVVYPVFGYCGVGAGHHRNGVVQQYQELWL